MSADDAKANGRNIKQHPVLDLGTVPDLSEVYIGTDYEGGSYRVPLTQAIRGLTARTGSAAEQIINNRA